MSANIFVKEKKLYAIITLSGLVGLLASFMQLLDKIEILKKPDSVLICNINAVFSCSNILNVWQSSVFGFPNSLMCVIFFAVMITAGLVGWTGGIISNKLRIIFMGMAWFFVGFGFWYLWQSIYIVGAMCIYCIFCYGAVLAISGSWLRLNYRNLRLNKKNEKILGKFINNNSDIAFWILIAIIIAIEAITKFA